MKLKTKIIHSFDIESDLLDDIDFNVEIKPDKIKKKRKIIEVKKSLKFKEDVSTRLF